MASSGKLSKRNKPALVLDNGSAVIKSGLAGVDANPTQIPCVIGYGKHERAMFTEKTVRSRPHVGTKATKNRGLFRLEHPVQRGQIKDWDAMMHLWEHAYSKINKKSSDVFKYTRDHGVLIVEPPLSSSISRKKMAERFFEYFHAPGMYFANGSLLALLANGKTTGLVLDCGHGTSTTVPVLDGQALPHCISNIELAGVDVTTYLNHLLQKHNGIRFHTSAEMDLIREMKESLLRNDRGAMESDTAEYQLPDGISITIRNIHKRAPNILFRPGLLGRSCLSLQNSVLQAVGNIDAQYRRSLSSKLLVVGGSSMMYGFQERLQDELNELIERRNTESITFTNKGLVDKNSKIKVMRSRDAQSLQWIGGSLLGSLPDFQNQWITREEYNEVGPSIVHR